MTGLLQDLRYAFRQLGNNPGFATVAVLTLAFSIAANTTIFSVVDAVLLKPLPFPEADRLVTLWGVNPSRGWTDNPISPRWFVEWQKQNHVFAGMAAWEPISFNLTGTGTPEEVQAERTTPNLFSLLGVTPLLGRSFVADDMKADSCAALLSYGVLWMELKESLLLLGIGIALGLPATLAATRLVRAQLFGLRPSDPFTLTAAVLMIASVTLATALFPARRAAKVDPMVALRYE